MTMPYAWRVAGCGDVKERTRAGTSHVGAVRNEPGLRRGLALRGSLR